MTMLIVGLLLFFGAHFYSAFRSRVPGKDIKERWGEKRYMGLYSLVSGLGLVLIIWGYARSEPSAFLFYGISNARSLTLGLMLPALVLIIAADFPKGYIKHWLKHPMLLALILWSCAHLLDGADLRQVLLFGSFLLFAVIDLLMVTIRKPAPSPKPGEPHWRNDLAIVVIGVGLYYAIGHWLHDWLFGVDAMF